MKITTNKKKSKYAYHLPTFCRYLKATTTKFKTRSHSRATVFGDISRNTFSTTFIVKFYNTDTQSTKVYITVQGVSVSGT
jgi:hypothetical protein